MFTPKDTIATRESASEAENAIGRKVWNLFGGSADLNESTFTDIKEGGDFERGNYASRNLHFGIREHGMCSILNGIAVHGGFIPYGSSFMVFTDYCRGSIRLSALMGLQVIYVFTHDSIGVGEDGPTHQPIEHLTSLRAIPESDRHPAGRRERSRRGLARRDDAYQRARADGALPAKAADVRSHRDGAGAGAVARRVRAGGNCGARRRTSS